MFGWAQRRFWGSLIIVAAGLAGWLIAKTAIRAVWGAEALSNAERSVLVRTTREACVSQRIGETVFDPRGPVKRLFLEKYCDCYATEMGGRITKPDLDAKALTPELNAKMEAAAAVCNSSAAR